MENGTVMTGSNRILVVDDEETIADLIRDVLSRHGCVVDTSAGGRSASSSSGSVHLPSISSWNFAIWACRTAGLAHWMGTGFFVA